MEMDSFTGKLGVLPENKQKKIILVLVKKIGVTSPYCSACVVVEAIAVIQMMRNLTLREMRLL